VYVAMEIEWDYVVEVVSHFAVFAFWIYM